MIATASAANTSIIFAGTHYQFTFGDVIGFRNFNTSLTLHDSSLISANGDCVRISVVSVDLPANIMTLAFSSLTFSLVPAIIAGNITSDQRLYYPTDNSYVAAVFLPRDDLALQEDPGVLINLQDTSPPTWSHCPDDIYAVASNLSESVVVWWTPPVASDNVGVVLQFESARPGSSFSVLGSPHIVSYAAKDAAENIGTCAFQVFVTFTPVDKALSLTVFIPEIVTDILAPSLHASRVSSTIVDTASLNSSLDFSAENTEYTRLLVSLSSTDRLLVTTSGFATLLEVDLTWKTPEYVATGVPSIASAANAQLHDANTSVVTPFRAFSSNWFQSSFLTTVENGRYLRIKGTAPFTAASSAFSGMTLSLDFPAGQTLNGEFILQPGSFVRVTSYNTDAVVHGNFSPPLQIIDTVAPAVFGCPENQTFYASLLSNGYSTVVRWVPPTATDIRHVKSLTSNYEPGDTFSIGEYTVQYLAEDYYGNVNSSCRFAIKVVDDVAPFIQCRNASYFNLSSSSSTVMVPVNALDPDPLTYVDNSRSQNHTINTVSYTYAYGAHYVMRTVRDASNNSYSCTTEILVNDFIPPYFTNNESCSHDIILTSTDGLGVSTTWQIPTAHDATNDVLLISPPYSFITLFPIGTTNVVYSAVDVAGNVANCSFNVIVHPAVMSASYPSSSSTSSALVVGLAVGIGGGFLILIIILILWVRDRRRHANRPHNFQQMLQRINLQLDEKGKRIPREIARSHVKLLDSIGKGNFGEVCKGLLSEVSGTPGYLVAVKSLLLSADAERGLILQEAALHAQFICEFVVCLLGVVTVGEPLLVIMEFCEHGALNTYLAEHALSARAKNMLAGDCAEGLAYLSSLNFVHRDVAARNVLVSSERRAKIADFGMSRDAGRSHYYRSRGGQIPVRWSAPEALEERKFSEQSDCWSFGVLLYEIWTRGETPYKEMSNEKVWVEVVGGYRLPCPEGCPSEVYDVMLHCWFGFGERPTFQELTATFRRAYDNEGIFLDDRLSADSTHNNSSTSKRIYVELLDDDDPRLLQSPNVSAYSGALPAADYTNFGAALAYTSSTASVSSTEHDRNSRNFSPRYLRSPNLLLGLPVSHEMNKPGAHYEKLQMCSHGGGSSAPSIIDNSNAVPMLLLSSYSNNDVPHQECDGPVVVGDIHKDEVQLASSQAPNQRVSCVGLASDPADALRLRGACPSSAGLIRAAPHLSTGDVSALEEHLESDV